MAEPLQQAGELDIAAIATAFVTSEAADHPIENAFDQSRSRWIASEPGEQVLMLAFNAPQSLYRIELEAEARDAWAKQPKRDGGVCRQLSLSRGMSSAKLQGRVR